MASGDKMQTAGVRLDDIGYVDRVKTLPPNRERKCNAIVATARLWTKPTIASYWLTQLATDSHPIGAADDKGKVFAFTYDGKEGWLGHAQRHLKLSSPWL